MYEEDEYDYDVECFLYDWGKFIKQYGSELPHNYLSKYGFENIQDLTEVINLATKGQLQGGLNRLGDVRRYLTEALKHEIHDIETRGYDDDQAMIAEDIAELEDDFYPIIEALKPKNFKRIVHLATPEEKMMVRSISRQSKVPLNEDVQKEIIGFIGVGGKKSKKTKRKRTQKVGRRKKRSTRKHPSKKH